MAENVTSALTCGVEVINCQSEEEAKATLKNAELLKQFKQVEELPDDEQMSVIKFVGAYLRTFKAKQAYAL